MLQFVNPSTILYGITVFSTFILTHYRSLPALVLFCLLLGVATFLCTACWAISGTVFQKALTKHAKLISAVLSLVLAFCAISLLLRTF